MKDILLEALSKLEHSFINELSLYLAFILNNNTNHLKCFIDAKGDLYMFARYKKESMEQANKDVYALYKDNKKELEDSSYYVVREMFKLLTANNLILIKDEKK